MSNKYEVPQPIADWLKDVVKPIGVHDRMGFKVDRPTEVEELKLELKNLIKRYEAMCCRGQVIDDQFRTDREADLVRERDDARKLYEATVSRRVDWGKLDELAWDELELRHENLLVALKNIARSVKFSEDTALKRSYGTLQKIAQEAVDEDKKLQEGP